MDTAKLRRFAQEARRSLMEQVSSRMKNVLAPDSAARRESPRAVAELLEAVESAGEQQVIERAAYTWFNRFCALRFMDVNQYTRVGVVSPAEGQSQPELLADAKMGHIDSELGTERIRQQIRALLDGQVPSRDPQSEAYRLLLVAACNHWNKPMPFMFQKIEDYTELLLPDDLLSDKSILARTREALTVADCEDVEVIGWLYQFYISEKKDEVFEGLKKNRKITPENIPAATQLFTPHWIVQYLVQNSLGRLWLLNRPDSRLAESMEYYIPPETPEQDFLEISRPEEIKVCDPACGSGHMLSYAFDLLYAMYEEDGYDPVDIPELILTNNLYGIEIDERAGALAAFALTMKARAKHRRFFSRKADPNICVLKNVTFEAAELERYIAAVGPELFTPDVRDTLKLFCEANNFGSLIMPAIENPQELASRLAKVDLRDDMFLQELHERVTTVVQMAGYLTPRYQVVVANPPYLSGRGMNATLNAWARKTYPKSKADLFAMFIERCLELAANRGTISMITMQSWMFLSSYEALRERILGEHTIVSMAHLGARAFDSIGGEVVATTAFVIDKVHLPDYRGAFIRLVDGNSEAEKRRMLKAAIVHA